MTYHFTLKDLVGNALIETMERVSISSVKLSQLETYQKVIVEKLRDQHIEVIPSFSRDDTYEFELCYSEFIKSKNLSNDVEFCTRPGISSDDLRKYFRVSLPFEVLKGFTESHCIESLLRSVVE